MFKSYFLAKLLKKLRISSFRHCQIDSTARVDSECSLSMVTIGRYLYVGSATSISDTCIGNFCSIGGRCAIGGGIHPTDMVSTSPAFLKGRNILGKHFAELPYKPSETVDIGNDVWVGEGVYIRSGVKIGDGAVIGAHAVVTRDVEPYSVVAGIPARAIRKRFDDETIERLLEIRWWEWPDKKLEREGGFFLSPDTLFRNSEEESDQVL